MSVFVRLFGRLKRGDFEFNDKEPAGSNFDGEELKSNQCRTIQELSESLGVDDSSVSKRLKTMG